MLRLRVPPSFGDIFATNSTKNGLLPIVLPEATVTTILEVLQCTRRARVRADLASEIVTAPDGATHRSDPVGGDDAAPLV